MFFFRRNIFFWLLPFFLVLGFNLTIFNRFFPLTEGWWETYGYLMNQGLLPYKDFYLEFPPLIPLLNTFFLKLHFDFFDLRLLGVCLSAINVLLIQLFLTLFFEVEFAAMGAMVATFLFMVDRVYIPKDYQSFLVIVIALSLITGVLIWKKNISRQSFGWVVILAIVQGFCLALALLIKQNIGIFLGLAYLALYLFEGYRKKNVRFYVVVPLLGIGALLVLIPLGYYFLAKGVSLQELMSPYFSNDSKGSPFTVLFRFITDADNRKILFTAIVLGVAPFFLSFLGRTEYQSFVSPAVRLIRKYPVTVFLVVVLSMSFLLLRHFNFAMCSAVLGVCCYLFIQRYIYPDNTLNELPFEAIAFPFAALAYCNTHSTTFNFTGLIFCCAFSFAYGMRKFHCFFPFFRTEWGSAILICGVVALSSHKIEAPYNWWGLEEASIFSANSSLPYPELRHIKTSDQTAQTFSIIHDAVQKYSHSRKDVYFFPDIPIFYLLENKLPPYKGVVEWFDVITKNHISEEFEAFKKSPPNLVVVLDPPDFVYEGHAKLINRYPEQKNFVKFMSLMVQKGCYQSKTYIVRQKQDPYEGGVVSLNIQLQNPLLKGLSISELVEQLPLDFPEFQFERVTSMAASTNSLLVMLNPPLVPNGLITIRSAVRDLEDVVPFFGSPVDTDYYLLRVYVRDPHLIDQCLSY